MERPRMTQPQSWLSAASAAAPRITHRVALLGLVVLATVIVAGCGGGSGASGSATSTGPAPAPGSKGTLTIAWAQQPQTLDATAGGGDTGSEQIQTQIFDELVEQTPGTVGTQPGLATSWERSRDALTWTFHLRDAKFSDGTPVTANDVAFSVKRDLNPKFDAIGAGLLSFIKNVTAPDARTAVFHLKSPTAVLPEYLTLPPLGIVPAKYFQRVGASGFARHPIGSGPFKLVGNTPGQSIVLQRNPYYWRTGYPYVNRVVFNYIPNDNTRMLAVRTGSADIGIGVPYGQIATMRAAPGVRVQVEPLAAMFNVLLSWKTVPAVASQAVRQALNYATPSADIRRVVFAGAAPLANSQMEIEKYSNPAVKPYPYDLAKAKQLMASSPTPHGFPIQILIVGGDTASVQTAAILQQAWAKIGVKVTVRSVDIGTFFTLYGQGSFGALLSPVGIQTSDIPVEDEIAQILPIDNNAASTYYRSPAIVALVKRAVTTLDEGQRRKLFFQLQQKWMQDPEDVPIVFTPAVTALRSNVAGFGTVLTNYFKLYAVSR
jgi:peptide/nickel transport system substrate-binding protein